MPTGSFTLDELYGTQEDEGVKLVPAKRTPRGRKSTSSSVSFQVGSDVEGILPKDKSLQDLIVKAAQKYGVPEEYGLALAQQESGYNPAAFNDEFGAAGMFQYIPETAKARGIDPLDPAQAADAAMADFAERMKSGGVEEAIQSHFAGPGGGNRGPKTRQYLADVAKRANDIARALGKDGETPGEIVTGSKDEDRGTQAKAAQSEEKEGYSIDELYGATGESIDASIDKPFSERAAETLGNAGEAISRAAKGSFEHVKNRLFTDLGMIPVDDPRYTPVRGQADPFGESRDLQERKEELARPEAPNVRGFLANVENPMKLLLEDSLPANFMEALVNAPENDRQAFMDARKVMMQENIVANPQNFPAVSVEAAKQAIAAREAEQDKKDPAIKAQWNALKQAAQEDPGKFGAQLANSLMADPELLAVPLGMGTKVIATGRTLATGAETTSRIIKTADSILDAATLGSALNTAITAADQLSTSTALNTEELKFSAMAGAAIGGPLGAIFSRGARAHMLDLDRAKVNGTYEDILRDRAKYDVEVEAAANGEVLPNTSPETQARINRMLGITSKTDTAKFIGKRRADVKAAFKNESDYADYLSFKAEERILRSEQYAAERQAANRAATREARRSSIAQARAERAAAARSSELQSQFDEAVAARDLAEQNGQWDEAIKINKNLDDLAKMDEDDAIQSAFDKDVPAIKRALNRASQKDSKLARPKWQRGEVDPELLLRGGIAAGGAAAGFALAPEELKKEGLLGGALAGLFLPAGGRVFDRMRQSGVVSLDGGIPGMVIKESQLPNEIDIIRRAQAGEQSAYSQLFDQYYTRLKRNLKQGMGNAQSRAAVDVDDLAQTAMLKAFRNLDSFDPEKGAFYTWLYKIGENELYMSTRRGKRRPDTSGSLAKTVDNDMAELGELASKVEEKNPAGADTPENTAIMQEVQKNLADALSKLPRTQLDIIRLKDMEGFSIEEISKQLNMSAEAVRKNWQRGRDSIQETLRKRYGAEAPNIKGQKGEIDPRLLKTAGVATVGAGLGAYFADQDKKIGAVAGAGAALLLSGGGRNLIKLTDDLLGASSTRILNKSPAVFKKIMTAERRILAETHANISKTGEFLVALNKKDKATQDIVNRALLTGDSIVINKVLEAINDPKLSAGYKQVRSALDSLGDKLVGLKRFKRGNFEYFPRVVKDKEGLFKAIGKQDANNIQQALEDANVESLRKNGRPVSTLEEAAIINKILFADKRSTQPGWSKERGIEEITPELLQYYFSPAESLHTYIRSAVSDIERAKFFGEYAKNMKKGDHEFLDVDRSVHNLMAEEIKSDKLSQPDAREIADIIKARFGPGELAENDFIRNVKNIGNIGLLGNFWSAGTQLADVGLQVYVQGLRPTVSSVIRQLTGRKHVDMRDFGLADHISEEFANELKTTRWVNKVFKLSLFSGVDRFGKNTALNAAVIRAQNLVKAPEGKENTKGIQKLADKYQAAFGDDFSKLVSELKSGKISDLTRDYAFMELSQTQPISRIEMPLTYLKHPNARSYLWLKSFAMKQADLIRREAYNEIKKGNVAKGVKNLVEIGVVMGLSGAGTQMVKDWMLGRDVDFQLSDVPLNMFKTFGYSEYMRDQLAGVTKEEAAARREAGDTKARTKKAEPISAIASAFKPPFRMFDELLRGDPKAYRYLIPGIGPYLAEQVKKEDALRQEAGED